jgi:hypothetical protein
MEHAAGDMENTNNPNPGNLEFAPSNECPTTTK